MNKLSYRIGNFYSCPSAWTWNVKSMNDFDIWMVTAGRGRLDCDGIAHKLVCGDCFIFKPGARIIATHFPDSPLQVVACHFDVEGTSKSELTSGDSRFMHRRLPKPEITAGLLGFAVRNAQAKKHEAADFWLAAAVGAFFEDKSAGGDYPVQGVRDLDMLCTEIAACPGKDWTIEGIARALRYSGDHCRRLFLKHKGMPPMEYVIRRRIERACFLLKYTDMQIGEIASELNYGTVFYFSRQFRKMTGETPRGYRGK